MKEMKYQEERTFEVLHEEDYKEYKIVIVSYGTHPCGYVGVPKDSLLHNKLYLELYDMDYYGLVHGGFTYSRFGINGKYEDIWFLGWDYTHSGDYNGYYNKIGKSLNKDSKKWTTKEILKEARKQVDEFIKLKWKKKITWVLENPEGLK